MNFRKLLTYFAFGTAAVIPFAGAQNPTILQGSYISNVFGQSNFIKNPNAQTNIANVTTVTATVTRSTTTPLVATSEFNVAIGTANGTATWSTRTFDAGMKNNNCEARFNYRGFAATSKVDIKQGANTVASLNLTPATDPRIASINFPCGDLSTATTFVVTDTSTLAGTNEIGGIYVGLATNMANVAQAENVVYATKTISQSIPDNTTTTVVYNSETTDQYGEYNPATGIFTAKRSGRYLVNAALFYEVSSFIVGRIANISVIKNGGTSAEIYNVIDSNFTQYRSSAINHIVELTIGDTLQISTYQNAGASRNIAGIGTYNWFQISRFPSASELVVTPERQNTWAGVVYTNEGQSLFSTTSEPTASTSYTNATWNQPTKLKGKASVTTTNSGNDLGFSVANLPVGNYKFDVTGLFNAQSSGGALNTRVTCSFRLIETTTTSEISSQIHQDTAIAIDGTRDYINAFTGVFNNTSVGTRNFRIEAQKIDDNTAGNVGSCQAYSAAGTSSNNTKLAIIMTPLDQPSNSALYVQGPVLGAQTGAAIPAGYVGELKRTFASSIGFVGSSYNDLQSLTLSPGTWSCSTQTQIVRNGATVPAAFDFLGCIGGNSGATVCTPSFVDQMIGTGKSSGVLTTFTMLTMGTGPTQIRYTGANIIFANGASVASVTGTIFHKVYLDASAGTPLASGSLECTRLN